MVKKFEFAGIPVIKFGPSFIKKLPEIIADYGDKVLIITGNSFRNSSACEELVSLLGKRSIKAFTETVHGEPSPDIVDEITGRYRESSLDLVVAIGGGSVLDTGKAVSALLTKNDSVMNYLEGVGTGKLHDGEKIPFVAVPTTSGTGSEATKNAVLSRVGADGFKKSLRHDNFVPDIALIDPELTVSCPPEVTAASGLDALTQLLESYSSTKASPLTDSLAIRGIEFAAQSLLPVSTGEGDNLELRSKMAYASLVSGITLANAGLGVIHGLASPVGGFFNIPHGVVCGTLLAEAIALNIKCLKEDGTEEADYYLEKYARAGQIISNSGEELNIDLSHDRDYYCEILIEKLREWVEILEIPRLGEYGISTADLDRIAEKTDNKNNPVKLDKEQIKEIIRRRL
ncbi:MAG: iron-containing alcohol dehydrogenase [Halanaerobiaceae bacterium]|nr:iron-containing alcohol dehydrogenase [Halanaerobiaceae bacterium]